MNYVAALPAPIVAADPDPLETQDWIDALESVYHVAGADRAVIQGVRIHVIAGQE